MLLVKGVVLLLQLESSNRCHWLWQLYRNQTPVLLLMCCC